MFLQEYAFLWRENNGPTLSEWLFDAMFQGVSVSHTIQAMSEYERKHWVEAMGGTWPAVNTLQRIRADSVEENLNSMAFTFLKDCLAELEDRGLNDQGLYRVGGVVSKVKKLLNQGLDPQPGQAALDLGDPKVKKETNLYFYFIKFLFL